MYFYNMYVSVYTQSDCVLVGKHNTPLLTSDPNNGTALPFFPSCSLSKHVFTAVINFLSTVVYKMFQINDSSVTHLSQRQPASHSCSTSHKIRHLVLSGGRRYSFVVSKSSNTVKVLKKCTYVESTNVLASKYIKSTIYGSILE